MKIRIEMIMDMGTDSRGRDTLVEENLQAIGENGVEQFAIATIVSSERIMMAQISILAPESGVIDPILIASEGQIQ